QKKERNLDHLKNRLSDRRNVVEKRAQEMEVLLQQQAEKLQAISRLSRDQAEKTLQERHERELPGRSAARPQTCLPRLKQAVQEAKVGPLSEKLVQMLGRLKFRTSYSQNVLQHSLEVAFLCGMVAEELGLDGRLARRCGLLHDIGKAADHEMEGGHPKIGAELAKRYGETSAEVLHAIIGHHDDVTIDHVYTVLVAAADAISAARPGARRETLEKYV